jgi:hypothetical protein
VVSPILRPRIKRQIKRIRSAIESFGITFSSQEDISQDFPSRNARGGKNAGRKRPV